MDGTDKIPPNLRKRPGTRGLTPELAQTLERTIRESVSLRTRSRLLAKLDHTEQFEKPIEHLFERLLMRDSHDAGQTVLTLERMQLAPVQIAAVCELLALRLGAQWESDETNFLEVTVAMSRLHAVLRLYCERNQNIETQSKPTINALISTVPGEQHLFAATLLELMFTLQGWQTTLIQPAKARELHKEAVNGNYDVLGISWTSDALTQSLFTLKGLLDKLPSNHTTSIVAGGLAANKRSKWLVRVGFDTVAESACEAIDVISQAHIFRSQNSRSSKSNSAAK